MNQEFYEKYEEWKNSCEYNRALDKEKREMPKVKKFVKDFSLNEIKKMRLDDYVIGNKSNKTFCYRLEVELKNICELRGRTTASQKYGIYWDKNKNKYVFGSKVTKKTKFGKDKKEIFENLKNELFDLIDATKNGNYKRIANNRINNMVKNKIVYLYDAKNQLPILSEKHINMLLTILDIPYNQDDACIVKRNKLFKFYKDSGLNKEVSPYLFMCFVYNKIYGYGKILKPDKRNTKNSINVNKKGVVPNLIDIGVKKHIKNKQTKGSSRLYSGGSEETKRLIGKRGENFVKEYLENNKEKLNIKIITAWCEKDDLKGYDFSYLDKIGREYYIEVKSTKIDSKNRITFDMSVNEFEFMKKHKDNYYIFFVKEAESPSLIQRIKGSNLIGFQQPSKYNFSLERKKMNK